MKKNLAAVPIALTNIGDVEDSGRVATATDLKRFCFVSCPQSDSRRRYHIDLPLNGQRSRKIGGKVESFNVLHQKTVEHCSIEERKLSKIVSKIPFNMPKTSFLTWCVP